MKRVWKRISALLVVCAVLAALAPAALADGGADISSSNSDKKRSQ